MKPRTICLALLLLITGPAAVAASPPAFIAIDHSTDTLVAKKAAMALWQPHLTARLARLYPPRKWGFVSEVEGGFDSSKSCVITARAMLMPRSGKWLLYAPAKTATTFEHLPNATMDQCKNLAGAKLKEAIDAMVSTLLVEK
jgi:hypothetical protein